MKYYEVETSIDSAPEQVWTVLTDLAAMPDWDSGITQVDGEIALGNKITVHTQASPGRAFPLTVAELVPASRMVWKGGMPFGLFRGVRTYEVTAAGTATHFRMREEFSGPLLGLIWRTMPDLGPSFTQFAEGLKTRVETLNHEETQR